MDQAAIKRYLGVIRRACDLIEQQLDAETSAAFQEMLQETIPQPNPAQHPQQYTRPPIEIHNITQSSQNVEETRRHRESRKKHVDDLMAIDCWPPSVPQHAVGPTSESDQINRARAVLDMSIGKSIEGAHFLDYGCGEGYIASEAASRGCASVVGYDVAEYQTWTQFPNVKFTTSASELHKKGYDLIFLYDVLDHCEDPVGVMTHVFELAAPGCFIYARCHPWTSKHASHLPKVGLNKSHVHLFLTWDELVAMGYQPMFTRMEKKPLEAYRWWFKDFKILKEEPRIGQLSDFFYVPAFKDLIKNEQQLESHEIDEFLEMMKLDFVDFVLQKSK